MKLLYYNWDRIDGGIGGGVGVYQKNLVNYLLNNSNHEIYILSSGLRYTEDRKLKLKSVENKISDKIKTFEIYNSPVIAPAQQSIKNLRYYLEDMQLYSLIKDFVDENGGFDVIHFNNMEGLSINVLKLKEIYPQTKFIFSLHNYFLVCSKVSLWQSPLNGVNHNCISHKPEDCLNCYNKLNYGVEIRSRSSLEPLKKIRGFGRLMRFYTKLFPDNEDINLYREFEQKNLEYSNKYFDSILAVSNRVKEIFINHGFDESKIKLSYIGTDVADIQKNQNCADINTNPFKIVFLGYMNEEKGFYFLLKALDQMPDDIAKDISVTVASGYGIRNFFDVRSLKSFKSKFSEIILLNGYKRSELKNVLEGKHLGIVPVMWEDNLPQTAMELIGYGVPIICSNLGGASELHNHNEDFTFEAGNVNQFIGKFNKIFNDRSLLKTYWKSVRKLTSMSEHAKFLETIYK